MSAKLPVYVCVQHIPSCQVRIFEDELPLTEDGPDCSFWETGDGSHNLVRLEVFQAACKGDDRKDRSWLPKDPDWSKSGEIHVNIHAKTKEPVCLYQEFDEDDVLYPEKHEYGT